MWLGVNCEFRKSIYNTHKSINIDKKVAGMCLYVYTNKYIYIVMWSFHGFSTARVILLKACLISWFSIFTGSLF